MPRASRLPHGTGRHRKAPWQVVHSVSVMEQNLDLSSQEGGRTAAMTEDGTVLRFDSICCATTPVPSQLHRYIFAMRSRVSTSRACSRAFCATSSPTSATQA